MSHQVHRHFPREINRIRRQRQFPNIRTLAMEIPALNFGIFLSTTTCAADQRELADVDLRPALVTLHLDLLHFEVIEGNERGVEL